MSGGRARSQKHFHNISYARFTCGGCRVPGIEANQPRDFRGVGVRTRDVQSNVNSVGLACTVVRTHTRIVLSDGSQLNTPRINSALFIAIAKRVQHRRRRRTLGRFLCALWI